jgi:hypothetical protein
LEQAALISPAEQQASASGPGYDLYAATGCVPGPGTGILEEGVFPNTGNSTLKPIKLTANSFQRFYIAVHMKAGLSAGDDSCSLALLLGSIQSGAGKSCSVADFTPNATSTIDWCGSRPQAIPPTLVVLTVLASCLFAAGIIMFQHRQSKRRDARVMCEEAEKDFRISLSERSNAQVTPLLLGKMSSNPLCLTEFGNQN